MTRANIAGLPGIDARLSGADQQVWWGVREQQSFSNVLLSSVTVDAGNTPTTQLRGGLVLGQIVASGKYIQYSPTAVDGSEVAKAVLEFGIGMLDAGGTAVDKAANVLQRGNLKAGNLIGIDSLARAQLGENGRFIFDDDLMGLPTFLGPFQREINYSSAGGTRVILASENGTLFTTTGGGAVTFTLPAWARGLAFMFTNTQAQNMVVQRAGADTINGFNNLVATTLTFNTASNLIGAAIMVYASQQQANKWYVRHFGSNTLTVA